MRHFSLETSVLWFPTFNFKRHMFTTKQQKNAATSQINTL